MPGTARGWCRRTLTGATLAAALAAGTVTALPAAGVSTGTHAAAPGAAIRGALRLLSSLLPHTARPADSTRAVVPTMGIRN